MYLFYKHIKNKKTHIFIISFLIFIFLNIAENFIHYNIGRHDSFKKLSDITLPNKRDLLKIIVVMIIFAFLQGGLTYLLE